MGQFLFYQRHIPTQKSLVDMTGVTNFYFKLFWSISSLNLPPECIRMRIIKDNNFSFAVICCLVIVRRSIFVYGHDWQLPDNIWQQNQNWCLLFSKYSRQSKHIIAVYILILDTILPMSQEIGEREHWLVWTNLYKIRKGEAIAWSWRQEEADGDLNGWTTSEVGEMGWRTQEDWQLW